MWFSMYVMATERTNEVLRCEKDIFGHASFELLLAWGDDFAYMTIEDYGGIGGREREMSWSGARKRTVEALWNENRWEMDDGFDY